MQRVARFVSLYVKQSEFTKALKIAQKQLQEFGAGVVKIGAGISAAGVAITGAMATAAGQFATAGAALQRLATQTGTSANQLSALQFAAEQSGAEVDDISGALEELNIRMGEVTRDGTGPAAEAFKTLGIDAAELGKMMPIDRLMAVGDALAGVQDAAARGFLADEVIGGDAFRILPLLMQGRAGMEAMMQAGRDLGVVLSDEDAAAASELSRAFGRMRAVMSAVVQQIGAAVAPAALQIAEGFTAAASAVIKFIRDNRQLIVTAAKIGVILSAVGAAIVGIGGMFIGAGLAISGVLAVMSAFGAAIGLAGSLLGAMGAILGAVLSPVGLLVVALVGGAVAWLRFTETGRNAVATLVGSVTTLFGNLRETVTNTFGGIVEAIRAGDLALAGQIAMVGLRLAVMQGLEAIHGLFGETIGTLVGQVANGDLAGAWATLGSTILNSLSQVANGIVAMFTSAIDSVVSMWRAASDEIVNGMLNLASQGGLFGKMFEAFSGVDMQAETKRTQDLEAQRRGMGLKPQTDDIASQIAAGTYKDPGIAAIEANIKAATAAVTEGSQEWADATQAAVDQAVEGQTNKTSAGVKKLQDELRALREEAAAKIAAGQNGSVDAAATGSAGGIGTAGMGGRASVATNSLLALSAMASSPKDRIGEQQLKKADEQIDRADRLIVAVEKLGLFHA